MKLVRLMNAHGYISLLGHVSLKVNIDRVAAKDSSSASLVRDRSCAYDGKFRPSCWGPDRQGTNVLQPR